ncbi:MAG: cadmium-translocating P-type ATPase, partial [Sphaerochaetaceae bacterium]|nr:cadmium-translocating P-type ATPase [Sphaerochaetaceae bacterium]
MIKILIGAVLFGLSFLSEHLGLPAYVTYALIGVSYIVLGYETILSALKGIKEGEFFDETFLMTIATIGAFCIGEYHEAVGVMLFYELGEYLQDLAVDRSTDSIEALMNIAPEKARIILKNGEKKEVKPEEVKVGDLIQVLAGERIALDGVVVEGNASLDTKAVTGESRLYSAEEGKKVISGSIVTDSPIVVRVTSSYENSTVARIITLTKDAKESKAPTQQFITKFAKVYTPAVCALALLIAVVPSLVTGEWSVWVRKALTTLVISCPCALVLSVPVAFFGGIGASARKGILVKGGTHLETLASASAFVFDKTGTVTQGKFSVTEVNGGKELLEVLYAVESNSTHPLARSVSDYCREKGTALVQADNIKEVKGKGLEATVNGKKCRIGNRSFIAEVCKEIPDAEENAVTAIYACDEKGYLGCVLLEDKLKENIKEDFSSLRKSGASRIVILSGDNPKSVEKAVKMSSADEGVGNLLPQDKVEEIKKIREKQVCAFTGDGINDAPALATANVGISMGGVGSDAAIEASDIVIMNDSLSALVTAKKISMKTMKIAKQNIVFTIGIKVVFLALASFGLIGMGWAVFADTGVALLAVLNSLRTLRNE